MQPNSGTSRVVDLAERHSQDLDVFLMWGKRSGRLWVRVTPATRVVASLTPEAVRRDARGAVSGASC